MEEESESKKKKNNAIFKRNTDGSVPFRSSSSFVLFSFCENKKPREKKGAQTKSKTTRIWQLTRKYGFYHNEK